MLCTVIDMMYCNEYWLVKKNLKDIIKTYTRSDSKVMRLIFFWQYWQYCSPLTQTAVDLDLYSIPTCSGMALQ